MKNVYVNDFDNNNKIYYNDLKNFKPLTKSEERKLCKQYKFNNDISARNKLITSNLKFVVDIAKKYKGYGISFGDLVAEGNMGLIKALDKFDYNKDVKVISFGVWWIRQYIKEAINRKNSVAYDELPNEIGPTVNDDYDDDQIIQNNNKPEAFLDNDNVKCENENNKLITDLLKNLNERECDIVKSYFGIDTKELTLEEIGLKYNLTKERVRQIKAVAMKKLRSLALERDLYKDIYLEE